MFLFCISDRRVLAKGSGYRVAPSTLTKLSLIYFLFKVTNVFWCDIFHLSFRCLPRPANDADGCCHWRLSRHQLQPSSRDRRKRNSLPNSWRTNRWSATAATLRHTSGKFIAVSSNDNFRLDLEVFFALILYHFQNRGFVKSKWVRISELNLATDKEQFENPQLEKVSSFLENKNLLFKRL